jgi:hypothetical protein
MKASEFLKKNPITESLSNKLEEHLATIERQEKVRAFDSCGVCDSILEFQTRTDWIQQKVHEVGHCANCRKSTPSRVYPLQ